MAETGPGDWSLVDSHAHLDDEAFAGDLDSVLDRAAAAGVNRVVTIGADLRSSRAAVALAQSRDGVWAAVGVHPHDAQTVDAAAMDELERLARQRRVVAIGEIGLDFYRDLSPRARQHEAFQAQLDLARGLDKPVVVHDRDAHAEVLAALREWKRDYPSGRGVLHCFSGDEAMALTAIELGFYVSIAGPVTFAKAPRLHALAARLPLERMLVETDCPYLAPEPVRGRRNEPANVRLVAARVAELRGLPLAEVAAATAANASRLFGLGAA